MSRPKRFQRAGQAARSTPAGEHRPVLLQEVLAALQPRAGMVIVDCTVGWAGHAVELLGKVGPTGKLIGIDFDVDNLTKARERLGAVGFPFALHHGNFAGLPTFLAAEGIDKVDALVADLGMSSMQVDDAERGFSYVRDGPLDMRMDRSRGQSAAQLLATIAEAELAKALRELGDEPAADTIAAAIVAARQKESLDRTGALSRVIMAATRQQDWRLHPSAQRWNIHPAARTFQALRILVNRELANLQQLLRVLPDCLQAGGAAAIISFHSGEDRLVKAAFRTGQHSGVYAEVAAEPVRATMAERTANPRARSAKLRWARKGLAPDPAGSLRSPAGVG